MREGEESGPADSLDVRARTDRPDARKQNREVTSNALLSATLDKLQGLISVVNEDRQVVYANQAFLDFTGSENPEALCGMMPGETLHCIHTTESRKGCGDSESCRFCGIVQAITETQATHMPATRESSITRDEAGKRSTHEFRVRAIPFEIAGSRYVLVSLKDISGQKRRTALERIFFHDILNTASSIRVYLELLKTGIRDDNTRALVERIESICGTLLEEIQSQRILVSAENKTLTVQRNLIASSGFIEQVIQQFADQDISRGKKIAVAAFSEAFSFVSDDSLLRRVLSNAIRNALEASPEGATVTVGYAKEGDDSVRFWVHNPSHMEDDVKHQIFQRFFSTKGEDRGLGTYSMKLLGEEYLGGALSFESTPDKGTTFTLMLPRQIKAGGKQGAA